MAVGSRLYKTRRSLLWFIESILVGAVPFSHFMIRFVMVADTDWYLLLTRSLLQWRQPPCHHLKCHRWRTTLLGSLSELIIIIDSQHINKRVEWRFCCEHHKRGRGHFVLHMIRLGRTISRRNQRNMNNKHCCHMHRHQQSLLWICLWIIPNECWELMRLYSLWYLDCELGLKGFVNLDCNHDERRVQPSQKSKLNHNSFVYGGPLETSKLGSKLVCMDTTS